MADNQYDGPVMQAYEPTLRERLAQFLMGADTARPSAIRRNAAIGMAHLVPGISLQDAARNYQAGQYGPAVGDALAAFPIVSGPSNDIKVAQELAAAKSLRDQFKSTTIREASGSSPATVRAVKNTAYRTPGELDAADEAAMSGEGGYEGPTRAERLARQQAAKDAEQARLDAMASEGPISMNRVRAGLPATQGSRDVAPMANAGLPAIMGQPGVPATVSDQQMALALARRKLGMNDAPLSSSGNLPSNPGSADVLPPPRTIGGEDAIDSGRHYFTSGNTNFPSQVTSRTPEAAAATALAMALMAKNGQGANPSDMPQYDAMGNPTGVNVASQAPSTGLEQRFPSMTDAAARFGMSGQEQRYPSMDDIAARLGTSGQEKRFPSAEDRATQKAAEVAQIARDVPVPSHRPSDLNKSSVRPDFQSNGQNIINDGKINWGDSSSPADFVRASQALQDNPDMAGYANGGGIHPEVHHALAIIAKHLGVR